MPSIFTRIINKEIPCYKIWENDTFLAFLDINPVRPGHTLLIPKQEIDYIFDLPEETLAQMLVHAKPIARAIDKAMGCIRTGLVVEGLEVPHAHIHLIPIYESAEHASLGSGKSLPSEKMEEIRQQISANL